MAPSKVEEPLNLVPVQSDDVDGSTNGTDDICKLSRWDPNFTESVIKATGPNANPRLRKVMASFTKHLHDFIRENEITIDEYMYV